MTTEWPEELARARELLAERRVGGVRCPCCGQFAKIYRRTLHAGIARQLIAMYAAGGYGQAWVHVAHQTGSQGGDATKARYWGLIEEQPRTRTDGGRAGWWRLTGEGIRFVRGFLAIPKYVLLYDGRLLDHDGPPVDIRVCLGEKFDYAQLMKR